MYIWPAKKRKNRDREKIMATLARFIDFYSESALFRKMSRWGMKMGIEMLYYALILFYVLKDENVSFRNKMVIMGALGYLILPTDFVSDFIPVLGFSDDAAFLSFAVMSISNSITPEIKEKAKNKIKELIDETIDPEVLSKLLTKDTRSKE